MPPASAKTSTTVYLPVSLVNHGAKDGTHNSDGLALSVFHAHADVGMSDKSIGFKYFRNLLLYLQLGQTGDTQAHGNQRQTDRAGLANAYIAT